MNVAVSLMMVLALLPLLLVIAALNLRRPDQFCSCSFGLGAAVSRWSERINLAASNEVDGPLFKSTIKDERDATCVGTVVRSTSLDELPELLNVIPET